MRTTLASAWRMTLWIAGAFSIFLGAALLLDYVSMKQDDPLNSTQLKAYREKLRSDPADERLKTSIRQLDLKLRSRYFHHLARNATGIYLFMGGAAVFLLTATKVARLGRKLPMPKVRTDAAEQTARTAILARWSVAGSGAAIGILLFGLSMLLTAALPKGVADAQKLLGMETSPGAPADAASQAELSKNWPRFRGPDGSGISRLPNVPTSWNAATGAGIAWKIAIPASGFNSPIIWGERLFFSGADASANVVFCLDGNNGRVVWRQAVAETVSSLGPAQRTHGGASVAAPASATIPMATSTMATDGRRVYAFFGNGMLAAFAMEGQLAWSKNLGPLKNTYGHAASLALWQDRLILQLDQGEPEEGKSRLYAFAGRTGEVLWQRPRRVGSSWASPLIIESAGKAQVITLAVPWVIAYALTDGAELWRVERLNGEVTPSAAFGGGLLFVISPSEKLLAIRPDGSGDVTKSHVAWSTDENVPDITSPVSDGDLVYTLSTPGVLTCFDVKEGKKQWQHDFELEFHSSPSLAEGRLYLFSLKGTAIIVEAGRQFKEIFRTEMVDTFSASPAFSPNEILMRGETNLWCIGSAGEKLANKN